MRQELYRRVRGIYSAGSGLEFPGDQAKMRDKGKTGRRAADNAFFLQDFLFLILLVQRDRRLPACGGIPKPGETPTKNSRKYRLRRGGGDGQDFSGWRVWRILVRFLRVRFFVLAATQT